MRSLAPIEASAIVNWYEHHLRGYDADTQHLSWDQDMAYTRLLRWYYRKEQPVPADLDEACRQVRASDHREAVQAVLAEFFELRADGWHRQDCDERIASYRAGEPEREAKKTNEGVRLARHRAERAELFHIINAAGHHRPYNSPIADLRKLAQELQEAAAPPAETRNAETLHATGVETPATATHSQSQTHSYITNTNTSARSEEPETPATPATPATPFQPLPQPANTALLAGAVCLALKAAGIGQCNPGHPKLAELLNAGAGVQNFVSNAAAAKDKGNPFAWVLAAVEGQLADAKRLAASGAKGTNGHGATKSARAARMAQASPSLAEGAQEDDYIDVEAHRVAP